MISRLQTQNNESSLAIDFPSERKSSSTLHEESGNSREVQLLLACSRTAIDPATAERVRSLLNGEIRWTYLLEKAHKHCVMPLLCRSLESTFPELVPDEVLESLRGSFRRNALNNLFRTKEMMSVLHLFESKGIPVLPFKGPVLAASIYGDLGLRQFGDLDILVHSRHLKRAKQLLLSRGYHFSAQPGWMDRRFPLLSRRKDLILISQDHQTRIELHWRLTSRHFDLPLDMKRLWDRLVPMSYAGSTIRSLPLEDLILYLCMHGSRHSWERLAWVCDVAELIRVNPQIDWDRLMHRASNVGSERMLALGLLLANGLLDAPLPKTVLSNIKADQRMVLLGARVSGLLFQDDRVELNDISYWYQHHLKVRERPSDRLRLHLHYYRRYLLLIITPNSRDHEILALPRFFKIFYYLLRAMRLSRQYGSSLFKTPHRAKEIVPRSKVPGPTGIDEKRSS